MSTLERLAVDHPYYCSDSNYYSNDGAMHFGTMSDFLDEFEQSDIDMNLCFRWDIQLKTDCYGDDAGPGYCAHVHLMLQRKGIFRPCNIDSVSEDEAIRFEAYARRHLERLQQVWAPLWVIPS